MDWTNKVAIVTGGASGIGLATTIELARRGTSVMIADWSDKLEDVQKLFPDQTKIAIIKTDVSKEEDVKRMVEETVKRFGHVDYAVANAGIGSRLLAHEETMEEWNQVIGVNQTGVFLTNKYVLNQLLKQQTKGAIVNMTSILGLVGSANAFAYSATKGALISMTRTLAVTYATQNIRINAIAPGYIDTPILEGMTPEIRKMLEQAHPIHRLGAPEEIANTVCFLLSDDASFITGVTLPVDGGYVAQ